MFFPAVKDPWVAENYVIEEQPIFLPDDLDRAKTHRLWASSRLLTLIRKDLAPQP